MVGVLASHPDAFTILVHQNGYQHKRAAEKHKECVGPANAKVDVHCLHEEREHGTEHGTNEERERSTKHGTNEEQERSTKHGTNEVVSSKDARSVGGIYICKAV